MKWLTVGLYGWAVGAKVFCFLFSLMFRDRDFEWLLEMATIKSVLYGVSAMTRVFAYRRLLQQLPQRNEGLTPVAGRVGLFFLFDNLVHDFLVLVPFVNSRLRGRGKPQLTIALCFSEIASSYSWILVIPWFAGGFAD